MKKHNGLWSIVYGLIAVILVCSFTGISCAQREGVGTGDKAPDFTLQDVNGTSVTLSEVVKNNKVTLLVFWATWCPYCTREIPELKRLELAHKGGGLKILAIDVGESDKKLKLFVRQEGIPYTVLLDPDNRVTSQYGVMGIPTNILLDDKGIVRHRGGQPPPEHLLP